MSIALQSFTEAAMCIALQSFHTKVMVHGFISLSYESDDTWRHPTKLSFSVHLFCIKVLLKIRLSLLLFSAKTTKGTVDKRCTRRTTFPDPELEKSMNFMNILVCLVHGSMEYHLGIYILVTMVYATMLMIVCSWFFDKGGMKKGV